MNDWQLLRAWATQRSEAAFAEIVHRHLNLVYNSALRQVRDAELARDVAQAVFLVLARKAGGLGPNVILVGWLLRTTHFVAVRALRTAERRHHYEHLAAAMNSHPDDPPAVPEHWREVEPHLDAVMATLPGADRDALVLRYFDRQPVRTVAERLGISEEAAKKRLSRALERLRLALGKRRVPLTSVTLTALLLKLPTSAAPAEYTATIAAAATGGGTSPAVVALADAALRHWAQLSLRIWIPGVTATLLLIVSGAVWLHSQPPVSPKPVLLTPVSAIEPVNDKPIESVAPVSPAPARQGPSSIMLLVVSARDNQPLPAQVRVNFAKLRDDPAALQLTTGTEGTVEIPVEDPAVSGVTVWVSAAGYVPMCLTWRGHEFVEPILLHTVRLQPGSILQGVVLEESGAPVPGAEVQFQGPGINLGERENIGFHARLTTVRTDAEGRFRSDQVPSLLGDANSMSYTVVHPEYVRERVWLRNPDASATNHVVVLTHGLRVGGRVLTADNQPIPGAKVLEAHHFAGPQCETTTDQNGNFTIGPFAPGTVPLEASAYGYAASGRQVPITSEVSNIVFQLADDTGQPNDWQLGMDAGHNVRITGTVADDANGKLIPSFRVRLNEHRGTALQLLGEGNNGHFDWPVFMAFHYQFSLQIAADGYEPVETEERQVQAGIQEFVVRLRRASELAGLVVTPDGRPVVGAYVGLNGDGYGHAVTDGRPWSGNDAPQTTTDAAGRFSFKPHLGAESVLVVHDLGCTQASVVAITNAPIVLQPWGAIEGTLLVGHQTAPGQSVALEMDVSQDDASWISTINVQGKAITDAQGQFHFAHVPAGAVVVARLLNFNRDGTGPVGFSHKQRVVVPPGEVAEVILGGIGRKVVGRLTLSRPLAGHDWRDDLQSLIEETGLPQPRFDGSPMGPEWREFNRRLARHWANQQRYYLEIAPDGTFQIADVLPGDYTLKMEVAKPPDPTAWDPAGNPTFRRPIGKLSAHVTIRDGSYNEPIDLGTFTIPLPAVEVD